MKALVVAAIALFSAVSALAQPQVIAVKQSANFMPPRDPQLSAIRTTITVQYESCSTFRAQNFEVELQPEFGFQTPTLLVGIRPDTIDCMGPTFLRTIDLVRTTLPILDWVYVLVNDRAVLLQVEQNFVH